MIDYVLQRVFDLIFDKPLPPPAPEEKESLIELQKTCRDFQPLETANALPSEVAWFTFMNRLRALVLSRDSRKFLRWDVITQTMFVSSAGYISTELNYLKKLADWAAKWRDAIKETAVGQPSLYWKYPASSGNLIHQAYHLARFSDKTAVNVASLDYVLEFGGGYGSMCRLFFNLGFKGKYVIFDLPLFSALQKYFLKTIGLQVCSIQAFKQAKTGVICLSDIQELNDLLSDGNELGNSMFVATWSIDEAPVAIRDSVLSQSSRFKAFLFAYNVAFGEVDNIDFFISLQSRYKDVSWQSFKIEHLPGNNYLFGGK